MQKKREERLPSSAFENVPNFICEIYRIWAGAKWLNLLTVTRCVSLDQCYSAINLAFNLWYISCWFVVAILISSKWPTASACKAAKLLGVLPPQVMSSLHYYVELWMWSVSCSLGYEWSSFFLNWDILNIIIYLHCTVLHCTVSYDTIQFLYIHSVV